MKNFFTIPLLLFASICNGTTSTPSDTAYHADIEAEVGLIITKGAETLARKHRISPCGTGVAMPGNVIQEFCLSFDVVGPLSQTYLRKALISCAQEFLEMINGNEKIRPYLIQTPLKIENVQIIFFMYDKNGKDLRVPNIITAEISGGYLTYRTWDERTEYDPKKTIRESYADALAIVQHLPSATESNTLQPLNPT